MDIIKDKNNVVLFAGENFQLTEKKLIAQGWTSPAVNSKDHTMETVSAIPDDWQGGCYSYSEKVWTKLKEPTKPIQPIDTKTAAINELKTLKSEAEGKTLTLAYLDKRLTAIEKIMGVA